MKLQLIVTHYNEPVNFLARFLDSLKVQDFIDKNDFEVLVINDGKNNLIQKEFFNQYNFSIKYFIKNWGGISSARQFGLNIAIADYVMFCDCDDLFLRIDGLYQFFKIIDEQKPDLIVGARLQDIFGPIEYISADKALIKYEVHNKVYNREFLIKNKIFWSPKIQKWHEDFYFNQLVLSYNPIIAKMDFVTYLWKSRANSISKVGNETLFAQDEQLTLLVSRYFLLLDELKARKRIEYFNQKLVDLLLVIYEIAFKKDRTLNLYKTNLESAKKLVNKFKLEILNISKEFISSRLELLTTDYDIDIFFNNKSFVEWWRSISSDLAFWLN